MGLVLTFYSTLVPTDEKNTSLRSIEGSFEIEVLPSDIVQITNTLNDDILCKPRDKLWEELRATEEEVSEVLIGKRNMQVRDIHTSYMLTSVRAIYYVVQHIMLPRSSNTDVMFGVDHMVMFFLMTRRRINLVRLILDFMALAMNVERRRHTTLPYGMFLTRVFRKVQLPINGHRADNKRSTTTMKTFSALGLKPKDQELEKEKKKKEEKEEKKKDKKKKDSSIQKVAPAT